MASVDAAPREGAQADVPERDVVIRTERLSKTYAGSVTDFGRGKQAPALLDLNMEVLRGEVFAMIGPNGSGKTTTLKLLMGLIFPSSGRAEVLGRNPRTDTNIKRRIGFMPDGPYFYGHLNGFELLDFYANLLGMPADLRKRRIPQLLDLVGMTNRARRRVRTYSKGMVQRIGLAHALLNDPEIVFLDEPTSGLDPLMQREAVTERRVTSRRTTASPQLSSAVSMTSTMRVMPAPGWPPPNPAVFLSMWKSLGQQSTSTATSRSWAIGQNWHRPMTGVSSSSLAGVGIEMPRTVTFRPSRRAGISQASPLKSGAIARTAPEKSRDRGSWPRPEAGARRAAVSETSDTDTARRVVRVVDKA